MTSPWRETLANHRSERERSYWLFIQRRQLSITRELRSNDQTRQRWSNMNQYSVTVMPISRLKCFQNHLVVYCLAVKWESLLRLVGGAWYFLDGSQHGCRVTNFHIFFSNPPTAAFNCVCMFSFPLNLSLTCAAASLSVTYSYSTLFIARCCIMLSLLPGLSVSQLGTMSDNTYWSGPCRGR